MLCHKTNYILYRVMSCNLSFIFDNPIIYKTVKYIDKSDNSSKFSRIGRLHLHWSVEYDPWQCACAFLKPQYLVVLLLIEQLKIYQLKKVYRNLARNYCKFSVSFHDFCFEKFNNRLLGFNKKDIYVTDICYWNRT
jgi:hypothetical protein